MFISSARLPINKLLFPVILALLLGSFSNANEELDRALNQASVLQSSEINLIEARLELERWKHSLIQASYADGFASWLQVRRHRFTIDALMTRLKTAREFQAFLTEVQTKKQSVGDNRSLVFDQRQSSPIKIFLPGSIRLIGWIEGQSPAQLGKTDQDEAALKAARAKLAKAQKRLEVTNNSGSSGANFRQKAILELALARREMEFIEASFDNFQAPSENVADLSISTDEIEHFATATQDDALELATWKVMQAETAATGHIQCAQLRQLREQRRVDEVRRLHAQGNATEKELRLVTERLANIQSQLEAISLVRETRDELPGKMDEPNAQKFAGSDDAIDLWPAVVFSDKEFAMHLVDLRREFFNERMIGQTARLKAEFLQQVLGRLKAAIPQTNANSETGMVLKEGQLREIESYEIDIEYEEASLAAGMERQQILNLEANRFIQQVIALNNAAGRHIADSENPAFDALGMLSRVLPTSVMTSNRPQPRTRYSYLESGNLIAAGRPASLSFALSNQRFFHSPYTCQSLSLFNLQPLQSSPVYNDLRRSRSGQGNSRIEAIRMKYAQNKPGNDISLTPCFSGSPRYETWTQTANYGQKVFWGQSGYRALVGSDSYPNGILRADLRSSPLPGQVPWYVSGPPANVFSSQLYYRLDSIFHPLW